MPRANAVSWHKTGRWYFSKTINGKKTTFYADPELPKTVEGKRKATKWMKEKLDTLADRVVTVGDWRLDDLRVAFLTWCKRRVAESAPVGKGPRKSHTFNGHRKHLNLICKMERKGRLFGELLARDLTTAILTEIVDRWKAEGRGPTTIRNRVGSLQAMLNWAAKSRDDRTIAKLIPFNPIAQFDLPEVKYQGERYAAAAEVGAFLDWLDAEVAKVTGKHARFERLFAKMVRFIAETGARPCEVCAMEWRHYDESKGCVVFMPDEHKTGHKTKRPRFIVITSELAKMFGEIEADPDRHPSYIFTHAVHRAGSTEDDRRWGDPWNSNALSRRMKEYRRLAIAEAKRRKAAKEPTGGLELLSDKGLSRLHLYRLRHTHITNMMEAPDRPETEDIADLHGTSPQMINRVYHQRRIEHLRNVVGRVQRTPSAKGSTPPDPGNVA